jgi:hypothetical protein
MPARCAPLLSYWPFRRSVTMAEGCWLLGLLQRIHCTRALGVFAFHVGVFCWLIMCSRRAVLRNYNQLLALSRLPSAVGIALVTAGLFLSGHPERYDALYSHFGSLSGLLMQIILEIYMQHVQNVRFWWSWGGLLVLVGMYHVCAICSFFELDIIRYLG